MGSTYLLVNLGAIAIPLLFSFHPRLQFWEKWPLWLPAIVLPAIPFLAWDVLYTYLGVWGFNPEHLLGVSLLGLPLEEWLFFFAIPYACLFTYASLQELTQSPLSDKSAGKISAGLATLLITGGILNITRLYTGVTFLLTGLVLLIHLWRSKFRTPAHFYPLYLIIFAFPFLIVNGILTGTGLPEPVVWYNDNENLGVRILTIPLEDFVYGFLLLFLNVMVYQWRLKSSGKAKHPPKSPNLARPVEDPGPVGKYEVKSTRQDNQCTNFIN